MKDDSRGVFLPQAFIAFCSLSQTFGVTQKIVSFKFKPYPPFVKSSERITTKRLPLISILSFFKKGKILLMSTEFLKL